jgi:membrane associated rhomboid family serine protease
MDRGSHLEDAAGPDGAQGGDAALLHLDRPGPLDRGAALALLDAGAGALERGDFALAARCYRRVVGFPDPAVTGAALLGLGQALFRLDREDEAEAAWRAALELPETPITYRAWRELAAALVRRGDLAAALRAYREAERRAPPEDRLEIASRLGWLAKETGDQRAARRYFTIARGATPGIPVSLLIIGITVVVSVTGWASLGTPADLYSIFELDKMAVAQGEYWRLWTVMLLHAPPPFGYLHLFFNMYALYLAGPLVEGMYGRRLFLLLYLLCGGAASVASFVFGPAEPSVGASGAIFGLFGVLFAAARAHHPVLDRQSRALLGSIGTIIAINVLFGFLNAQAVDNAAHLGGLAAGLWLGLLLVPGRVSTLTSLWQQLPGAGRGGPQLLLRVLGVAALVVLLVVGIVVGTDLRRAALSAEPALAGTMAVTRETTGSVGGRG